MINDSSGTKIIKDMAYDFLEARTDRNVPLRMIRAYIQKQTGEPYSHGMYSSAMRDLIEESNGRIVNTERGFYKFISSIKKREINEILDSCIDSLNSAGIINYLKVDQQDIEYIKKIPQLIEEIEKLKLKWNCNIFETNKKNN